MNRQQEASTPLDTKGLCWLFALTHSTSPTPNSKVTCANRMGSWDVLSIWTTKKLYTYDTQFVSALCRNLPRVGGGTAGSSSYCIPQCPCCGGTTSDYDGTCLANWSYSAQDGRWSERSSGSSRRSGSISRSRGTWDQWRRSKWSSRSSGS